MFYFTRRIWIALLDAFVKSTIIGSDRICLAGTFSLTGLRGVSIVRVCREWLCCERFWHLVKTNPSTARGEFKALGGSTTGGSRFREFRGNSIRCDLPPVWAEVGG